MLFIQQSGDPNAIMDQQAEDDAFYAATLREMVALGLDIGRIIHQQVVAHALDSPHSPIPESASHDYDRVFRAVRRGILLAKRLNQPFPERPHTEARHQPRREPDQTNESEAASPEKSDRIDRRDRIDEPEHEDDLGNRPTPEIFNEIREDLGLAPVIRPDAPTMQPVAWVQRNETHDPTQTQGPPPGIEPTGPPDP
jgi:hypothetical protein